MSAEDLAAIKAAPDFAAVRAAAAAAGDALLANPPALPDGHGSWIFYYACPDDGTDLAAVDPQHHQCPKCKKVYTDERTVASYRTTLHYNCDNATETLGRAYAYTGDDKYARGVQRILTKYADDYHTYPGRLDRWGRRDLFAPLGGRRFVQSLDEAVGAIHLAKGYDLCRTSPAWSDEQRRHVENDFFRPTAESLLRFNQDINNHQTWYNAGLIAIASVLADAELVQKVLTMRGGYFDQLERSIGEDGLWYEGAMAYHNYALQPMTQIVDMARRLGLRIHESPKLRLMITGPLHAAYPDGSFPVINDSDPGSISMFQWAFEWGWKTFHDPIMAQTAAAGDLKKLQAMLGPEAKVEWPLKLKSEALAAAGLVFLRQGEGKDAACVVMDYGPHGGDSGGHGHFDKLAIELFANGREWLLDPGRLTYSHKEYKTWVKTTAAHNTVALGGRNQAATKGKLLWLKEGTGWSACAAESEGAYPGAMLRRYLLLRPDSLVDVFEVESPTETQIDLFAHANAAQLSSMGATMGGLPAKLGDSDGYQHLVDAQLMEKTDTMRVSPWMIHALPGGTKTQTNVALEVVPISPPGEEVFTAFGIGYQIDQKTPTLIRRVHGKRVRFVTLYGLTNRVFQIGGVKAELDLDKPAAVEWHLGESTDKRSVQFSREGVEVK